MSEGIRLGGGGAKPRNSTIVQRYASEDIPANYFVAEYEGYQNPVVLNKAQVSDAYGFKLNAKYFVMIEYDSSVKKTYLRSYDLNLNMISSIELNSNVVKAGNLNEVTVVHLKEINSILVINNTVITSGSPNSYAALYTYDLNTGVITTTSDQFTLSFPDTTNRALVAGEYNTNEFYVIKLTDIRIYALEKYKLVGTSIELINSVEMSFSYMPSSQSSTRPLWYIPEVQLIAGRIGKYQLVYNISTGAVLRAKSTSDSTDYLVEALYYDGGFRGSYAVDPNDNNIIYLAYGSKETTLYKYNITTGSRSSITLSSSSSLSTSYSLSAIAFSPTDSNIIYASGYSGSSYYYGKTYVIDLSTSTITIKYNKNYEYFRYVTPIITIEKVIFMLSTPNVSSVTNAYYRYALFIPQHVEIADAAPLFGLTKKAVKMGELAEVYTAIAVETMTVYGIPTTLAMTIKDDTVNEIQQEVTSNVNTETD